MPKGKNTKLKIETLAIWRREHGLPKAKKNNREVTYNYKEKK